MKGLSFLYLSRADKIDCRPIPSPLHQDSHCFSLCLGDSVWIVCSIAQMEVMRDELERFLSERRRPLPDGPDGRDPLESAAPDRGCWEARD
jgi:hypothetical protein